MKSGMCRYALINGVLCWGVPGGIVFYLLADEHGMGFEVVGLIISLLFWSVGGFCYGLFLWQINRRKEKSKKESK